jgi:hypothetical protein
LLSLAISLSREQALRQRLSGQTEVLSDVAQDAGQGTNPEARVTRNRDVVLAAFERGQPKMATGLTGHPVAQVNEDLREIVTGDVPRQPQAVMTSSRTKWRRMTLGT